MLGGGGVRGLGETSVFCELFSIHSCHCCLCIKDNVIMRYIQKNAIVNPPAVRIDFKAIFCKNTDWFFLSYSVQGL